MKTKKTNSSTKKNNNGNKLSSNSQGDGLKDRHQLINEAAYFRAEKRSFVGGDPVEDWLAAEIEINASLNLSKNSGRTK